MQAVWSNACWRRGGVGSVGFAQASVFATVIALCADHTRHTRDRFDEVPHRRAQRRRKHDGLVTHESRCAGPISTEPLHPPSQGTRLKISGVKPLSFAYFSLRQAKKSRCPPHRGNTNKPISKQEKAKAARTRKRRRQRQKNHPAKTRSKAPLTNASIKGSTLAASNSSYP